MNFFSRTAFMLARCLLCALATCVVSPGHAWASATCSLLSPSGAVNGLPATVAVARDLPNGAMLTGWASSTMSARYWQCNITNGTWSGTDFQPAGQSANGATSITVPFTGGNTFTVYKTSVPGVGIALGGYINNNGVVRGPFDFPHLGYEYGSTAVNYVTNGGQLFVALVKIGDITPGTVSGLVAQAYTWVDAATLPPAGLVPSAGVVDFNITPVVITVLTCQTPDVNIALGQHSPQDLPTVGPAPNRFRNFTINFNNCPSGTAVPGTQAGLIHNVQYRIDPSNDVASGFSNVAALDGGATAGGVGIQLYDSTGAVFPLKTYQALTGFDGTRGGTYAVNMSARYYRTGTLTAGTADATMTLTVLYQ